MDGGGPRGALTEGWEYAFPEDYSLAPGAYVALVSFDPADSGRAAAFKDAYGLGEESIELLGPYSGRLSNGGERIALEKPEPPDVPGGSVPWVIVDEVIYFDAAPWPSGADGSGQPLSRIDPMAAGNDPGNWTSGLAPTPGLRPAKITLVRPEPGTSFLVPFSVRIQALLSQDLIEGTVSARGVL